MTRLANAYAEKEKWSSTVTYMQRTHRVRPKDADLTERLFQLYNSARGRRKLAKRWNTCETYGPKTRSSTCTSWT